MQCKAKSKQSGERCKRHATPGKEVCRIHGGKTPSGIASPHYKTGRYSKAIPAKLMARYEEAQADPKLLELKDDAALLTARVNDMLTRVEQGDSPALWNQLRDAYNELYEAIFEHKDQTMMRASLTVLDRLISRGIADWKAWHEIQQTVEARRRVVESEHKRLGQMEQLVTVGEMMVLASALLASVQNHVTDRKALSAISADFTRLVTLEN